MDRPHIITISGKPGSGKSSTADRVAELLGYTRYSSGDMVRRILRDSGKTLETYNREASENSSLDAQVDAALRELRNHQDIVVDSRLGFYWLPESFKVYLDLELELATVRIYKDTVENEMRQGVGTSQNSLQDVSRQVRERMLGEQSRFRRLYGIDPFDATHFDFVIDTSRQNPQSVAIAVFDAYRQWLDSESWKPRRHEVPIGYSLKNKY
ncbi:MAG: cytidylate kinase family protein [Patescibacteria group bacterium]